MNKMLLMLSCITAYSLVCASEKQSPRKVSLDNLRPTSSTVVQPDSITPTRSRIPSDPILRVKGQSRESRGFVNEENAKNIYPYYNEKENK